ncbi:MAPEG family protein [Romeria aff. gracilis LEGE 07310]|uniref:MAPEG family protein n=1 Tax=Vasconcelosia minhoensis LEGE 07310 TaxID=915328 RepID=A0A8J7AEW1_9CYAN|nr:MAPEG family protein [Romeria gracilis]MBE9076153.1 MAPEG family protein [Romeria aff. gracilis LEGE 07310]
MTEALLSLPSALLYSIAIAGILIYIPFLLVGLARVQTGYDIAAPRAMFDKLPAYAQRATWAHQNSFESFMLYAPAALMAYITGQASTAALAAVGGYLVARLSYTAFYILSIPLLRSLSWAISMVAIGTLYFLSCRSAWMQ